MSVSTPPQPVRPDPLSLGAIDALGDRRRKQSGPTICPHCGADGLDLEPMPGRVGLTVRCSSCRKIARAVGGGRW